MCKGGFNLSVHKFLCCFGTDAYWSVTLREECRLGVFENRILRGIFGPNGEWKRLHDEELHSLYRSHNMVRTITSRRLRRVGHVARIEGRSAFKIFTGTPSGKRLLRRPRRRLGDNFRMDLKEIGIGFIRLRIGIIEEPL